MQFLSRRLVVPLLLSLAPFAAAQGAGASDSLGALDFLLGTWIAQTTTAGSAGAAATGTYTFQRDLNGHSLQRTSTLDRCKGPDRFDCQHHDQLTIFRDPSDGRGPGLHAFYLDSEGHVIFYKVTLPDPQTAVFLSDGPAAAPHFRLTYHLTTSPAGPQMAGRFEGAAPGSSDYHPYLAWSGARK